MANLTSNSYLNDPSNPLYFHPSEQSSSVIVNMMLTGTNNYIVWSRSMLMALATKNKVGFIDGTISAPPEEDPLFDTWKRCNMIVLTWIQNSVESSIANSILWLDKAYD